MKNRRKRKRGQSSAGREDAPQGRGVAAPATARAPQPSAPPAPPPGPEPSTEPLADLSAVEPLELPDLRVSLGAEFEGEAAPAMADAGRVADLLEELAEDMLDVVKRLKTIEQAQARAAERIDGLEAIVAESASSSSRHLSAIHRDLVSDRKALVSKGAFKSIFRALESIGLMRRGLGTDDDPRVSAQVAGTEAVLRTALLEMGFQEFEARPGELFNPYRMQCLGYAEGDPSVVVDVIRPGFVAGETVVEPAGVVIGNPASDAASSQTAGATSDEDPQPGGTA